MPIPLGILAQYRPATAAGSFDLLETATPSGSSSTVTFSNVNTYAGTYQHLQIRITGRSTRNETDSVFILRFNGDSGTNYGGHYLQGTGSSVTSGSNTSSNTGVYSAYVMTAATAGSNIYGAGIIDILDPFETTKNKTTRMLAGQMHSGYTRIALVSGLWMNTNAITSISLVDLFGNWTSQSRISLYGIKG